METGERERRGRARPHDFFGVAVVRASLPVIREHARMRLKSTLEQRFGHFAPVVPARDPERMVGQGTVDGRFVGDPGVPLPLGLTAWQLGEGTDGLRSVARELAEPPVVTGNRRLRALIEGVPVDIGDRVGVGFQRVR
jgi:hypothetical protein